MFLAIYTSCAYHMPNSMVFLIGSVVVSPVRLASLNGYAECAGSAKNTWSVNAPRQKKEITTLPRKH